MTNILNQSTDNLITNTRQGFKDFFLRGVSLPRLKDGLYEATLKAASFVEADKSKNKDAADYVRLELQLSDRIIVDNRFEKGFGIFESQVKEQLGLQDQTIAIPDLLQLLMKNPFKIWISYQEIEDRTFRNINYIAPRTLTTPDTPESTAEF